MVFVALLVAPLVRGAPATTSAPLLLDLQETINAYYYEVFFELKDFIIINA